MVLKDRSDQEHVRTVVIELKPVGDMLTQNARRERAKTFAILDLQIHHRLHLGRTRIPDDAATTQSAWTKLQSSLMQSDDFPRGQQLGNCARQLLATIFFVRRVA